MRSLWNDLLFLHGHVADVELARRLAHEVGPAPQAQPHALRKQEAARATRPDSAHLPPRGDASCHSACC